MEELLCFNLCAFTVALFCSTKYYENSAQDGTLVREVVYIEVRYFIETPFSTLFFDDSLRLFRLFLAASLYSNL